MTDFSLDLEITADAPDSLAVDYRLRSDAPGRLWVFDRGLMLPATFTAWPNYVKDGLLLFAGILPMNAGRHAVGPCRPFVSLLESGAEHRGTLRFPLPVPEFGPFEGWTGAEPHELRHVSAVHLALDVLRDDSMIDARIVDESLDIWSIHDQQPKRWPRRALGSATSERPFAVVKRSDTFARIHL